MKKQSIYLYIRKYLNEEEGNITKMNIKKRYAMYKPELRNERDFLQTSKGYLPRVSTRERLGGSVDNGKAERYKKSREEVDKLDTGIGKGSKKTKVVGYEQNLGTSRKSNISSRRRVNQMLRRDKQINNLHRNGHHEHKD
jgi:hypothetical protein